MATCEIQKSLFGMCGIQRVSLEVEHGLLGAVQKRAADWETQLRQSPKQSCTSISKRPKRLSTGYY